MRRSQSQWGPPAAGADRHAECSDLAQAVRGPQPALEERLLADIVGLLRRAKQATGDDERAIRAEALRLWSRLSVLLQRDGRGASLEEVRRRIREAVAATPS